MKKYQNQVIQGDCLEVLKDFKDNSIDTIITDPPYGLSFMGKKWDYDVPSIKIWKECLRVLKPGGTALIFAGSRTQHRMAVNVEDAGFELFDCIQYLYGSGFPKSHNIGKATKDEKWNGWGTQLKPAYEPILCARKRVEGTYANNALKWGVSGLNIDGGRIGYQSEDDKKNAMPGSTPATEIGTGNIPILTGKRKPHELNTGRFPANIILECICDEVIEGEPEVIIKGGKERKGGNVTNFAMSKTGNSYKGGGNIHTNPNCPCYLLDQQSGVSKSNSIGKGSPNGTPKNQQVKIGGGQANIEHLDKGGASRFFYCAKASKSERNAGCEGLEKGNNHCTVKPLKLLEYLCTLTKTPTKGIVLDMFAGSGTTGLACQNTGRDYILIEREEEYCKIAEARLNRKSQKPLL